MTPPDHADGPDRTPDSERLLLDAMLGTLVSYLRMCGYDAAYVLDRTDDGDGTDATGDANPDPSDEEIRSHAAETGRTIVTRDRDLAGEAESAVLLRSRDVEEQLAELAAAGFVLTLPPEPRRCGTCNAELVRVPGDEPTPGYVPDPVETPVWRCSACGQHFWRGSHWDDVAETLARIG